MPQVSLFEAYARKSAKRSEDGSPSGTCTSWNCGACTFLNSGYLRSCEVCSTPRVAVADKIATSESSPGANITNSNDSVPNKPLAPIFAKGASFSNCANSQKHELARNLDAAVKRGMPQSAHAWLAAVSPVLRAGNGYRTDKCQAEDGALPSWGALITSIKDGAPVRGSLPMMKRREVYGVGYTPVFGDDTRAPGCGDAGVIDLFRRSIWGRSNGMYTQWERSSKPTVDTACSTAEATEKEGSCRSHDQTTASLDGGDDDPHQGVAAARLHNLQLILDVLSSPAFSSPSSDPHAYLEESEHRWLRAFAGLPRAAQLFYAGVFHHEGPWFRIDSWATRKSLALEKGFDYRTALGHLVDAGLVVNMTTVEDHPDLSARSIDAATLWEYAVLLTSLTVKELKCLVPAHGANDKLLSSNLNGVGGKVLILHQAFRRILDIAGRADAGAKNRAKGGLSHSSNRLGSNSGEMSRVLKAMGPCVRLVLEPMKAIQRAVRIFMMINGYLPEEAVGILQSPRLKDLRFASPLNNLVCSYLPKAETLHAIEKLLLQAGEMEAAVEVGDRVSAYSWIPNAQQCLEKEKGNACPAAHWGSFGRMREGWMAGRILMRAVYLLEREKEFDSAVGILKTIALVSEASTTGSMCRSQAWARLVIDADHAGDKKRALWWGERGLRDPQLIGGPRVAVERTVDRLRKQVDFSKTGSESDLVGVDVSPSELVDELRVTFPENLLEQLADYAKHPLPSATAALPETHVYNERVRVNQRNYWQCPDGQLRSSVEEFVICHFEQEAHGGWLGCHSENSLWLSLLMLLMYDVLYSAEMDTSEADWWDGFVGPHQDHPITLLGDYLVPHSQNQEENESREKDQAASGGLVSFFYTTRARAIDKRIAEVRTRCL